MLAGIAAAVAATAYLADSRMQPRMAISVLNALPAPIYDSLLALAVSQSGVWLLDFAILEALALGVMLLCGWLAWPRRARVGTA